MSETGAAGEQLTLALGDYEGSLGRLVELARRRQVDLARVSMGALVDQYLAEVARERPPIERNADWLVLAAWLAYLKSCLLVPAAPSAPPEAAAEAARERHRLARLEAMRAAAALLGERPRLGRDIHARAAPEGLATLRRRDPPADLAALLAAYGAVAARRETARYAPRPRAVLTLEAAIAHLRAALPAAPGWTGLGPLAAASGAPPRTAIASMAGAALELARLGACELRAGNPAFELRAR